MPAADAGPAPLLEVLRARIRRDGPLRVDQYMQACLGDAEHGYYRTAAALGAGGDFITAPEISQVFGELIGLWCAVVWQGMGMPAPVRLVELGPGRGTLMRDCLRAARAMPAFVEAADVHLIEVSAPLREAQGQTLSPGASPTWHATLDDTPPGPAIVIANEFLDALPVRQLVFDGGSWRERMVDADAQGGLRFATGAVVAFDGAAAVPQQGAIVELRAGEDALLATLARRPAPLAALFVDYGPAEFGFGDTLQAVRRHRYADPLADPGRADLTAHLQFETLARKAREAGFAVDGPITQGEFLGRLGAGERCARLMSANPAEAGALEAGVQRLLSPTGMGGMFKVLAVRSPALPPPPPFG